MKHLLILLLFPIFSYSQNIGERIPSNIKSGMSTERTNAGITYRSAYADSLTTIYVSNKGIILAIDYTITLNKWEANGLNWVTKHKDVGKNVFYDMSTKDYYFVVYTQGTFIIQVRNEGKVFSL